MTASTRSRDTTCPYCRHRFDTYIELAAHVPCPDDDDDPLTLDELIAQRDDWLSRALTAEAAIADTGALLDRLDESGQDYDLDLIRVELGLISPAEQPSAGS